MATEPVIVVSSLSRRRRSDSSRYGRPMILDDLNLEMQKGEILGLIGPNGAGKTTLLKVLVGASLPDRGQVRTLSFSPRNPNTKNRIGFLPEEFTVDEFLTGWEVIRYQANIRGLRWGAIEQHVSTLGETLGMSDHLHEKTRRYSRGMKQTLGLLIALGHEPELILLDEPTSTLDPRVIRNLRDYLKEIRSKGRSVLISSHQLSELELISDTIALLDGGALKAVGHLSELVAVRKKVRVRLGIHSKVQPEEYPVDWSVSVEDGKVVLSSVKPQALEPLLTLLRTRGIEVIDVEMRNSSLEDVFLRYTSR